MLDNRLLKETRILLSAFKIAGKPAGEVMSDGQVEIAAAIIYKIHPRVASLAPTGYGKSEAISMGVVYRACVMHDNFIIGSVKYGTSDIIMAKTIEHIFDNPDFVAQLEIDEDGDFSSLDRLKQSRRKTNMTFKQGGGIKIVSLHGAEQDASKAIGEHVPNIVLDESPLLMPSKYLQVLKILEGTGAYNDTFLFELGNALNRNHFMDNIKTNPAYYKIDIGLEQAIAEGRLNQQSVDEKRGLPFFEQFYLCQFPEEDEIDDKGYRQILTTEELEKAQEWQVDLTDEPMALGVDVGGGGDKNVYVIRQGDHAWIETFNRSNDTMTNCTEIERIIEKYTVDLDGKMVRLLKPEHVYIDDIGIGRGVSDRMQEMRDKENHTYNVNGVSVGEVAEDPTKYKNKKAENYWLARTWLLAGGKLQPAPEWVQLSWIRYKVSTDKVLQTEPKAELKKRTGKSPDYSEAFMLTFSTGAPEPGIRLL